MKTQTLTCAPARAIGGNAAASTASTAATARLARRAHARKIPAGAAA